MKPDDLFDREVEWKELEQFAGSSAPGLRIGILYGRRRLGKSFMLRRLAREHRGLYHMAAEEEQGPALQRFADSAALSRGLEPGDLTFSTWDTALDRTLAGPEPLVIIDELPYLLAHQPGASLPSLLQRRVDDSRNAPDSPKKRIILCGSALAVMSDLLSGSKALRGRAELNMLLKPFDFRTTAEYYGVKDPDTAFHLYALFGGVPGYRDLLGMASPQSAQDFDDLLMDSVFSPSHALFTEPSFLLREDPRIKDRALYFSILRAVASGATTPSKVGAALGREARNLVHPLDVLISAGFLTRSEDLLIQRRPTLRVTDRIVRFHEVVITPRASAFEDRAPAPAWEAAQPAVRTQIYGPAFEELAREWVRRYASEETLGGPPGEIGTAVINDKTGRTQHEIDVVALGPGQRRLDPRPVIKVLGEAKDSDTVRSVSDLHRLEKVRELLVNKGLDAAEAKLMLFGRSGFSPDVIEEEKHRRDIELVDMDRIRYGS